MKREVVGLKFFFRNGETWTIGKEHIGDLWIKQITKSFGRIGTSDFQEIYPCESLRIEIAQEADHVHTDDINLGGLDLGMFERATQYPDIEMMDILYKDANHPKSDVIVDKDRVYFPYKATDSDGNDNEYQSSHVKDNHLYIVIDPTKTVKDLYPEKF